jgi:hypothetical protein
MLSKEIWVLQKGYECWAMNQLLTGLIARSRGDTAFNWAHREIIRQFSVLIGGLGSQRSEKSTVKSLKDVI